MLQGFCEKASAWMWNLPKSAEIRKRLGTAPDNDGCGQKDDVRVWAATLSTAGLPNFTS
jgi:hypothetical protein